MTTVGESLVATHFLTRGGGGSRSSRNEGKCFDINRANKQIQASQWITARAKLCPDAVFTGTSPTTKLYPTNIRYRRDSARRRSAARATPDLRFCYYESTDSAPPSSLARATPSQQQRDCGTLLRPADNSRSTATTPVTSLPAKRISRRRETTPLNHRLSDIILKFLV